MPTIINCEWSISRLYVNSTEVSDDSPNKPKLLKAIEFLRASKLLKKKKVIDEYEALAWASLLPMQLEVNFVDGDIFDHGGQVIVERTDQNTSWSLWTEDESVGFHISVKFQLEAMKKVTEKKLALWEQNIDYDWIGLSIASEGYEMDNGTRISWSLA